MSPFHVRENKGKAYVQQMTAGGAWGWRVVGSEGEKKNGDGLTGHGAGGHKRFY